MGLGDNQKKPPADKFDPSDEGESELDPFHTLDIQVAGLPKSGKTTGVCNLGENVLFFTVDGETKPIADKLNEECGEKRISVKAARRYLYENVDGKVKMVPKKKRPAAASKCVEYIKWMLDPARFPDGNFPDIVAFDSAEDLKTLCDWAARHEYRTKTHPNGLTLGDDVGGDNGGFWETRNNHMRDIKELGELLATRMFIFTTNFAFGMEKQEEPEGIKPDWTRRADLTIIAVAEHQKLRKMGERADANFFFRVHSCKRDKELPFTGSIWDMGTDGLRNALDEFFEAQERKTTMLGG